MTQTDQEYLDGLKKQIEAMEPLDRVCATILVQLGRIIAELINRHDWDTIKNMDDMSKEIFTEAWEVKREMGQPQ